jgi:hypothetical protein
MDASVTCRFPALRLPQEDEKSSDVADSSPPAPGPSDEVLMQEICHGSKEALSLLFRRYARMVRGVAYKVLRDTAEADDLLQEIFLLVHRLCGTFNSSKGPARFWILQMTQVHVGVEVARGQVTSAGNGAAMIRRASASTKPSSSASGSARLTYPYRSAVSPSKSFAPRTISSARPRPTRCGRRSVPPPPGCTPTLTSGWPSRVFSRDDAVV